MMRRLFAAAGAFLLAASVAHADMIYQQALIPAPPDPRITGAFFGIHYHIPGSDSAPPGSSTTIYGKGGGSRYIGLQLAEAGNLCGNTAGNYYFAFHWSNNEPSSGCFDWSMANTALAAFASAGIRGVLLGMSDVPTWASGSIYNKNPSSWSYLQSYVNAAFARAAANNTTIYGWEGYNEFGNCLNLTSCNGATFGYYTQESISGVAAMQNNLYTYVKAASPSTLVYSGTGNSLTDTALPTLFANGWVYFDVVANHAYQFGNSWHASVSLIGNYQVFQASLAKYGHDKVPVAITEYNGSNETAVTITIASPGVVTWNSHGFSNGTSVGFYTTGALPTGLTAGTNYYVVNSTTNTFQVSATKGGAAINTSGSQSGTQYAFLGYADKAFYFLQSAALFAAQGVSELYPYQWNISANDGTGMCVGASGLCTGVNVAGQGYAQAVSWLLGAHRNSFQVTCDLGNCVSGNSYNFVRVSFLNAAGNQVMMIFADLSTYSGTATLPAWAKNCTDINNTTTSCSGSTTVTASPILVTPY